MGSGRVGGGARGGWPVGGWPVGGGTRGDYMLSAASYLEDKLFHEYWGDDSCASIEIHSPEARIKYWLERADSYAKEWKPSDYLFIDAF